jgi:hypothetical protein
LISKYKTLFSSAYGGSDVEGQTVFKSILMGIEVRGYEFLMEFEKMFMRISFALHGQMVSMKESAFEDIMGDDYYLGPIAWQVAVKVIHPHGENIVILFTDFNKLAQFNLILKGPDCQKWGMGRNCDPMTDWPEFEIGILRDTKQLKRWSGSDVPIVWLISSHKIFNGFGLNHATEALHHASIHPMTTTAAVFKDTSIMRRLLDGLYKASRLPKDWHRHIARHGNLEAPFEFNEAGWNYYDHCINKVYRKEWVMVPIYQYEAMLARGQVREVNVLWKLIIGVDLSTGTTEMHTYCQSEVDQIESLQSVYGGPEDS